MLLQACLNGSRTPGEHPVLPITPQELARDAQRVIAAGARALHIHPRNPQREQSLAKEDIAAALIAIREHCPGVPVGVSTALWIEPDVGRRLQQIQAWAVLPDFASVNFSEPGTAELCTHLLSCNVGIEAGIWTVEDAHLLLKLGLADRCLRVLIELQEQEDGGDFYAAAWEGLCEKEQQLLVVTWTTSRPSSRGIEAVGLPVSETSIRYTT